MTKQNKSNKADKPKKNYNIKQKTNGILQLFVIVSISYMSYVVLMGLDDIISKILVAPALIWVALTLTSKFVK